MRPVQTASHSSVSKPVFVYLLNFIVTGVFWKKWHEGERLVFTKG